MTFSQSVIKYADSDFLTGVNLTIHQPEYLLLVLGKAGQVV